MRKSRYGYTWVTLTLFALAVSGHWTAEWYTYKNECEAHGQPVRVREYLLVCTRDTLENWQSEFLQLIWQVAGLAWLWHMGSPQSREGHDRLEEKIDFLLSGMGGGEAKRLELDAKYPKG